MDSIQARSFQLFSCHVSAQLLMPGVEKIADYSTNGPRNFFRSPERMKGKKEKGKREKKLKNGN